MKVWRIASSWLRRRAKVILITLGAILVTATFAYHRQVENDAVRRNLAIDGHVNVEQPKAKFIPRKDYDKIINKEEQKQKTSEATHSAEKQSDRSVESNRTVETIGDFDTHDMYQGTQERGSVRPAHNEKLIVYILPFTHVDPGWLKTFDAYSQDTNAILTNMHKFMKGHPKMRFMWAEFVFFERWWKEQSEEVKKDVREMVTQGRFELASGSWVMTDEANPYFPVSVDNIIEGHQFINKEFGVRPTTMWSNDPFGYSNSVPYIFSQAGVKRAVINRIHHGLKVRLQAKHAIPFRWRQYFDAPGKDDVTTQILPYSHYDILNSCGPNQAACCEFDFKRMTHWSCPGSKPEAITPGNVERKASVLVDQLEQMAKLYDSPVLLMMHGDDFRFDMIEEWYQHHDNFIPLFEEINKGNKVHIQFGTFDDYFTSLESWYKEKSIKPPVLTGDFFPYKCALGDLWTGYFTTRPFFKRQGRHLHALIRSADLLSAKLFSKFSDDEKKTVLNNLEKARRTLSLFQHHDAITGTSRVHVMSDYSVLLHEGLKLCREVIELSIGEITHADSKMLAFPEDSNQTVSLYPVPMKADRTISVAVYNSLPHSIEDTVSIRVDSTDIAAYLNGKQVNAQIEPYVHLGEVAQKTFLITVVVPLAPLGTTIVELKKEKSSLTVLSRLMVVKGHLEKFKETIPSIFAIEEISGEYFKLETNTIKTSHYATNGLIKSLRVKDEEIGMSVQMRAYTQSSGGAYLLRSRLETMKSYAQNDVPRILVSGPCRDTAFVFISNVLMQMTAKKVSGLMGEQLELGLRVDIRQEKNTEVVMQVLTDMNGSSVYMDSIGLQMLKRDRSGETIAANYYPMPSSAIVDNGRKRLTVVSNLEHGAMPMPGGIEIMIDRMLNQDDGKGLGSSKDAIPVDLLPVEMNFAFRLEPTSTQTTLNHTAFHSASGALAVQSMLYPPVATLVVGQQVAIPITQPAFPCGWQLLTDRALNQTTRLVSLFRHQITQTETNQDCTGDITTAMKSYLSTIGASRVTLTDLAGLAPKAAETTVDDLVIDAQPFDFTTLLVTLQ